MVIRIHGSVGRNGLNAYKDVMTVQTLINSCVSLLSPLQKLNADGKCGPKTVAAIEQFQRTAVHLNNPDGRVDPNGRTLRAMLSKSATAPVPPVRSAPAVVPGPGSVRFPLASRPPESYKQGMRRFGANRSGGRLHAGCDLYAKVGTPILALDNGEVQAFYDFYLGTRALVVQHPNFVACYGEVAKKLPEGVKVGVKITRGQTIAYVGHLTGLNMSMLHLDALQWERDGSIANQIRNL